jgi:tetratricopeptide (TPR) repeat protein
MRLSSQMPMKEKEKIMNDETNKKIREKARSIASAFKVAGKLHKEGKLKEAEEKYDEILEIDPRYKPALYYLASLYNQQKRYKDSMKLYEKIVAIDPGYQHAKEYYEKLKR